jgi:hypothetical protein
MPSASCWPAVPDQAAIAASGSRDSGWPRCCDRARWRSWPGACPSERWRGDRRHGLPDPRPREHGVGACSWPWRRRRGQLDPALDRRPPPAGRAGRRRRPLTPLRRPAPARGHGPGHRPQPPGLLMDEPLSNLDAKPRVQMRTTVARLQNQLGTTTVYVTHDQTEAMTLGDRVAVMRAGDELPARHPGGRPPARRPAGRDLILGIRPDHFEDAVLVNGRRRRRQRRPGWHRPGSGPARPGQPGPRGPAAPAVVRPRQAAPVQPGQRGPPHPVRPLSGPRGR